MRLIITASIALLQLAVVTADATTHKVPQDFAKIQLAINAAVNRDTVLVAEGTYLENLIINKKIVLGSLFISDADTSHISKTIIDGGSPANPDSASVFCLSTGTDSTTVIAGFTIQNGKGTRSYDAGFGKYWRGGFGIYITAGGANIHHNIITGNSLTSSDGVFGGGIALLPGDGALSYWIIENNQIRDNSISTTATKDVAAEGGGVWLTEDGRFNNNMVMYNSAIGVVYGTGGGISLGGSSGYGSTTVEMSNNYIRGNHASHWGGGIISYIDPTLQAIPYVTLKNNIITDNSAAVVGAAMHIQGGTYTFINNTITDNTGPQALEVESWRGALNMRLMNNIIWNPNSSAEIYPQSIKYTITISAQYTCIRGGYAGTGNISSDPKFVANDSLYRLSDSSPCIGRGALSATVGGVLLAAPSKDYSNVLRPNPLSSNPDIGAMESVWANPVLGNIIRVPQDYTKIQEAINASVNGDVVLVSEGTYTENLLINKKITLASLYFQDMDTSHISKTIIDGSTPTRIDTGATITCVPGTDTTTLITGLTITGGKGNKHNYAEYGWGIWREGGGIDVMSGGAKIRNNIIRNNVITAITDSLAYAGISSVTVQSNLGTSHVIIEDNLISNNLLSSVHGEGGGIGICNSKARIMRNRILNNTVTHSGGISVSNTTVPDTVVIADNLIQGNVASVNIGGLVFAGDSAKGIIRNNTVIDNTANAIGGIAIGWSAYAVVDRNYVARNVPTNGLSGGIYLFQTLQKSIICNNIITGNTGAGIRTYNNSSAIVVNNTIVNNTGYGLQNSSGNLYAMNNIVKNAGTEIYGTVNASYNLIEGGFTGEGNINADPLFKVNDSLYSLSNTSPCIGAGISSALVGGVTLNAPLFDYFNTPRPRAAGTKPDMGAVENNLPTAIGAVKDIAGIPTIFSLEQNFPNPFNPSTTIRYALPSSANVKLSIYDLLGREIATLVNEEQSAGWKEVEWNARQTSGGQASNVSSGIYFYKLHANNFVEVKKMLILK